MPSSQLGPTRRAVVLSERVPVELSRMLDALGLEIRVNGDPTSPDVVLADPLCVASGGLENAIAIRTGALLAKLGDAIPALHEAVMGQAERGLFKAVLNHTSNHLGRASKILGLDRNTCARKARAFGLMDEPLRGRKPTKSKPARRSVKRKALKKNHGKMEIDAIDNGKSLDFAK